MSINSTGSLNLDRVSVAASLIDCLSYALRIDDFGNPLMIWHAGSLQNLTTPPAMFHFTSGGRSARIDQLDTNRFLTFWNALMSGNKSTAEFRIVLSNGEVRWVRDTATPIYDRLGGISEVIGSVQDITKLHTIHTVPVDEGLIKQAFSFLDYGIALWDSDEHLMAFNQKFETHFHPVAPYLEPGLAYAQFVTLLAQSNEFLSGAASDDWVKQRLICHAEGGSSEYFLPDGRVLTIAERKIGDSGSLTIIDDVSTQHRGELALRQAKDLAETADASKSRFLRAANHDLRQPLATLKILIYNCMVNDDREHLNDMLHAMDISASIMEDILGVLLQVGQLDAGKITTRITNFQLAPFLERLRIQFEHQAKEKGLILRIIPRQVTLYSDQVLLERIISNFVSNAIKFTMSGKVLIGCRKQDNEIRLEVHDSGCGILQEYTANIFEEFYQVPGSPEQRSKGLGLGLNIAHRLAKLLDHSIQVRSKPGRGSIFSVTLPMGDVWKSETGEPEVSEAIGGQFVGTKVLILEDDEILRGTISDLLVRWGMDIEQAEDRESISLILENTEWIPDLLLADYRLGDGLTGTGAANEIRQKLNRNLPCIVMTADTEPELIKQIKLEKFPVLIKPISPPQLRVLMHNILFEPELLEELTDD